MRQISHLDHLFVPLAGASIERFAQAVLDVMATLHMEEARLEFNSHLIRVRRRTDTADTVVAEYHRLCQS